MRLITSLLAGFLLSVVSVSTAAAVTVDELLNLKANGLSDDILVALIESDGSVFRLSPDDVLSLHRRGLGEKVIVAMLATARRAAPGDVRPPAPVATDTGTQIAPAMQGMYVPAVQQSVSVPPFQQSIVQNVEVAAAAPATLWPVPVVYPVALPVLPRAHFEPLFWGYGGKPRPGSWRRTPIRDQLPEPTRPTAIR